MKNRKAEHQPSQPLVIGGTRREPAAYLGLGILFFVLVVMSFALWEFAGQGPWPVPIVWAVGALIALPLLSTREVRLAREGITLTRHLFRWHWTRRLPSRAARFVRIQCEYVPSRHQRGDGTPEGEVQLLMFTVTLRGHLYLTLGFSRDADAMERLAHDVARNLGVPAFRRGYVRRPADRLPVRVRKRAEVPLD